MTPIKDYALIGNCETAALINPNAGIDWLCLPAFDAAPIFNRLLDDEKGGDFTIHPVADFETTRRYVADSAIFETRFLTRTGVARLNDFFVIARQAKARFHDFTSLHPTSKLVRLVECESGGPVEMELKVRARPDYARKLAHWEQQSATAFFVKEATIFTNAPMTENGSDLIARFIVERDRPFFVVLDYSDERQRPNLSQVRSWLRITTAFWREWNLFNYYRGPHAKLLRRSAVTLKLLTYAKTGGFMAAPTTSLPEHIGGDANWDYRFTWLRDTALFVQTLLGVGYSGEAKAFLDFAVQQWMKRSEKVKEGPTIGVLYPVCEAPIPPETTLDHLSGYASSKPVRMGNAAEQQFQLDNYGHVLQSFFFFRHTGGKIDADKRKMIECLTDETVRFWRRSDNGIWEERETSQFTYGKVMCWAALERARALLGDKEGRLAKVCAEIRREVLDRSLIERDGGKELSAKFDQPILDTSSLLAFTTGFLDEHVATLTRRSLEEKLARGPLLYRGEDKIGKEGAFLLCSFWWINHLIREGQLTRAEELLDAIIELASPLGLYSEEIDPDTGEFLGNFPQAFSHLGLIQSILNLDAAKRKRGFYALNDHEKFQRSVGWTIGWKGVIAGFLRVPKTAILLFSNASKWLS